MKKLFKILFVISLLNTQYSLVNAQNLVPNPSFEQFSQCPFNEGQISFADGWSSFGVSPDYFNVCDANDWGIPQNILGYQDSDTGNAYVGIIAYDRGVPHTDKEFIGRQLSQSLSIGQKYFVSFKVNLPKKDTSATNQIDCAVFACNKLGVLFTNTVYDEFNPPSDNNFAHIWSDSIITDTLNWINISGSFVADSSYSKIMLGIFFDNNNVDTVRLFKPFCDVFAYYFIDDVCVSTDSMECNQTISINERDTNSDFFEIYPNPTINDITIHNSKSVSYDLTVYNSIGQSLYEEKNISDEKKTILASFFPRGLLTVEVASKYKKYYYKILKL